MHVVLVTAPFDLLMPHGRSSYVSALADEKIIGQEGKLRHFFIGEVISSKVVKSTLPHSTLAVRKKGLGDIPIRLFLDRAFPC